ALIRVGLPGEVRVRGHLPAAQVDRLETRLHLLHRLIAAQGAERVHVLARREEVPESPRAELGERVLDLDRPTEPFNVLVAIGTDHAGPARGGDGRRRLRWNSSRC